MVSPELIHYIKEVKKGGHSHDVIRTHLVKHGYSHKDIDDAYNHPDIKTDTKPKEKKKQNILPIVIMIFVLGMITLSIFFILSYIPLSGKISECQNVSIAVHENNGDQIYCIYPDNTILQIFLKNNGKQMINSINITVNSQSNKFSEKIDNFPVSDVIPYVKDYSPEYGKVKSIVVTPSILIGEELTACSDKKLVLRNIKTC